MEKIMILPQAVFWYLKLVVLSQILVLNLIMIIVIQILLPQIL